MNSRRIDTADVAKLIRSELKARFPKTKFSVRSSRYAGGSSIRVSWTDAQTVALVESVIGHMHGASFDGMIDLKSYHDSVIDGERVHFGNDFLFCDRELSPAFVERVAKEASAKLGWPIPSTMGEAFRTHVAALNTDADAIIRAYAADRTGGHRYGGCDVRQYA